LNKRAFKTDESFLEKISIGAIGTKKVFEDLKRQGHEPIELERGSMSFKIWKEIKIKRLRVPDLLCLKCGNRVESRAKTKFEITMSHSFASPERGWDFGLNDDDFIALVKCGKIGQRPIDWKASDLIQYFSVKSMREAFKKKNVFSVKPKGATEGFEARITWPSAIASSKGTITVVDKEKIQYKRASDGRTITVKLAKNKIAIHPLVQIGERIEENQIVASVIPAYEGFKCVKTASGRYYLELLKSPSLTERYTAAKALYYFGGKEVKKALLKKLDDDKEHIYVRLEAASSLLKMGEKSSLAFFNNALKDPYLENRLECVIILGEIQNEESCKLLTETLLDKTQNSEIRAGAAWSLGEVRFKEALNALVKVFNEADLSIRVEAARALAKLNEKYAKETIRLMPQSKEIERAGIAWSLCKSGNFTVSDLLKVMVDDEARKWISWIIGTRNEKDFINQIEELRTKDKEVYFAVNVLWKILSSWVNGLDIY